MLVMTCVCMLHCTRHYEDTDQQILTILISFCSKFIGVHACQNHQNSTLFDKVIAKIKWCSFFWHTVYINQRFQQKMRFITNNYLRMTRMEADVDDCPATFAARHTYLPECSGRRRPIQALDLPAISPIAERTVSSPSCFRSWNQLISGSGVPLTWHSSTSAVPSGTSMDCRGFEKTGAATEAPAMKYISTFNKLVTEMCEVTFNCQRSFTVDLSLPEPLNQCSINSNICTLLYHVLNSSSNKLQYYNKQDTNWCAAVQGQLPSVALQRQCPSAVAQQKHGPSAAALQTQHPSAAAPQRQRPSAAELQGQLPPAAMQQTLLSPLSPEHI